MDGSHTDIFPFDSSGGGVGGGLFLLVYTAIPGSESHEKLELLSVIGPRHVVPQTPPNA
jgi:hypothetical protein